jgi:predicted AAA+ superfamily ATPase
MRQDHSVELLVELLLVRVGSTVSFASLARELQVSAHTIKHWLQILENLYVLFAVRPYHRNIARSIMKEPKYHFYDTGAVASAGADAGAVLENAVACALHRELQLVEDHEGRKTALCFLRDKVKREVDFLVMIDNRPRQLVEVKSSDDNFSPALAHFARQLSGAHALQVVKGLKRAKTDATRTMQMRPAVDYLSDVSFVGESASHRSKPPAG